MSYEKLAEPASKDNPRVLRKVKGDGIPVTVTDPGEYLSMTSGLGYEDITDQVQDQDSTSSTSADTSAPTGASAAVPPAHQLGAGQAATNTGRGGSRPAGASSGAAEGSA